MGTFDFGKYFGEILPLADALREHEARVWESTPGRTPRQSEYVLWLGCNVLRTVNLAESIVAVLEHLGVDFATLGGPANCCGIIHKMNGEGGMSGRMMHHTLGNLYSYRPKAVLAYCPSCHFRLDESVPDEPGFDVPYLHVTEFIADRLDELRFVERVERRVGLHTHTHSAQQQRDAEATKRILAAVPGLEVVEFPGDAEWGRHCSPNQLQAMGAERFEALAAGIAAEAKRQGLDALATVYHSCYREWCSRETAYGLEMLNYVELLCQGLGLRRYRPTYKELKLAESPEQALQRLQPAARRRKLNQTRLQQSIQTHFGKAEP